MNEVQPDTSVVDLAAPAVGRGIVFWPNRRRNLYIVGGVILCFLIVALLPFAPKKYGDRAFHDEAKNVALAIKNANPEPVTIIRAPGPVLFYAIPYLLVPVGEPDEVYWNVALLWTVLCIIVSIFLIVGAVQTLYGDSAANAAAWLSLGTPFWAYYSFGVNGEVSAFLEMSMFLYGWARWRASAGRGISPAVLAGIGLALFLLTKPSALGLAGLASVAAAVLWWQKERKQAVFGLICVGVMAGTSIGSSAVLKHFERPDYRPAQLLYFHWTAFLGSQQMRAEPWDWRFWDNSTRAGSVDYANFVRDLAAVQQEAVRTRYSVFELEWNWVVNDFKQHPFIRARMALVRALSMHVNLVNSVGPGQFHFGPLQGKTAYLAFHLAVNLVYFGLIAASLRFLIVRRRHIFEYWPLWGPWLALVAFHSVFYAEARYLFAIQPVLLFLAAPIFVTWAMRARSLVKL